MLAALGVVIPELLDLFGLVHFVEPVWWKVGYAKLQVKHWCSYLQILNLCSIYRLELYTAHFEN